MFFCGESLVPEKCEKDVENRVNEKQVIISWCGPFHTTSRQVLWLIVRFPGCPGVAKGIPMDNERLVSSGGLLKMSTASFAVVKREQSFTSTPHVSEDSDSFTFLVPYTDKTSAHVKESSRL